jgi:hypothetical protein
MRRPLFLGSSRGIGRLRRGYSLRERVEPGAQPGYLLLLSVHDIAELDVGALQERNFRFNPLDFFAGHNDSVADQQLKPNWWFPCIGSQLGGRRRSSTAAAEEPVFIGSEHKSNTSILSSSVARWRRVYLMRSGDYSFAQTFGLLRGIS